MAERTILSHVAYDRFKERLFSEDVRPGQFVSQRELVGLTGIPLAPMREALQKLEIEGLVHIVPQRSIQVAEANLKLIRNTFQLRMIVEKEAARRFAETASDAAIEEQLNAHLGIVERSRHKIDQAVLDEAQEVDRAMHDAMVETLDNELLSNIHRVNSDRIRLIRLDHGLVTPSSIAHVMREHLAVIEACRARDETAAAEAMEAHVSTALRRAMGL